MHLNSTFGSSHIARPAYQERPTRDRFIQSRPRVSVASLIPFGNQFSITYSKFENKLSRIIPNASNHSLYKMKLLFHQARSLVSPVSAILREISM